MSRRLETVSFLHFKQNFPILNQIVELFSAYCPLPSFFEADPTLTLMQRVIVPPSVASGPWDYKCMATTLVYMVLGIEPRTFCM